MSWPDGETQLNPQARHDTALCFSRQTSEKKKGKAFRVGDVVRRNCLRNLSVSAGCRSVCCWRELYGRANAVSAPVRGERTSSSLDSLTTALCLGADRPVMWVCLTWSASRFPRRLLAPETCSVKQSAGVGAGISTLGMACGVPPANTCLRTYSLS